MCAVRVMRGVVGDWAVCARMPAAMGVVEGWRASARSEDGRGGGKSLEMMEVMSLVSEKMCRRMKARRSARNEVVLMETSMVGLRHSDQQKRRRKRLCRE